MNKSTIVDAIILNTLNEDLVTHDMTSEWLFDDADHSKAHLIAKEDGILSGMSIFKRTFECVDPLTRVNVMVKDGTPIKTGETIAIIEGQTKALLFAERTALNFIQRMSGIATETSKYVAIVADLPVKIVDTRKTAPGLRILDKQAVRDGGGSNHRFNLSDGILIKDNHIMAAGGIKEAIHKCKTQAPHTLKIEVEVESIAGFVEAIEAGADIIMLDNMSTPSMIEAVLINAGRTILEASGNMTLSRVREVAEAGVDIISIGALTHSVKALDISLRFV
jgi:nicotinate-nucleotide pyrophosphorylase (carboxylating)